MRIAQVAPLGESVPPVKYGGTERIVSYLTEALVQQGHDVALYASGDSKTAARLKAMSLRSLRNHLSHADVDSIFGEAMAELYRARHAYDVIHFHLGWHEFPVFADCSTPCLTTLHGPLDHPAIHGRIAPYPSFPLVSISDAQRAPLPYHNWLATIYHGVPDPGIEVAAAGRYLVFLGRISPEKRPDLAIAMARRARLPLKIAAKIDPVNETYFEDEIRPLLDAPGVEFLGELGEREKRALLAGATALLFPIDWSEPFGLVMIEAFACGVPVVAFRRGSVPEIVEDGVTGFVVTDVAEGMAALERVGRLDRRLIQARFRERFTVKRMVRDYGELYRQLADTPLAVQAGLA
ncbi:MAG TPA: glycosyltransferase family 4 protein [Stellaceae bacterium]|nr:glycosyltransferase family 4 protein [Stellaceae bacterium]